MYICIIDTHIDIHIDVHIDIHIDIHRYTYLEYVYVYTYIYICAMSATSTAVFRVNLQALAKLLQTLSFQGEAKVLQILAVWFRVRSDASQQSEVMK